MQRDSAAVFTIALTITAAAFLALLYADGSLHRLQQHFFPADSTPAAIAVPETVDKKSALPSGLAHAKSKEILECQRADGTTIWTNAESCEQAALNSRVSVIEAPIYQRKDQTERRQSRRQTARSTSFECGKLALSGPGVSPGNVPRNCRWALGRALEVERMLSVADEPSESRWKDNYCRWIDEAESEGCQPSPETFCYLQLCLH